MTHTIIVANPDTAVRVFTEAQLQQLGFHVQPDSDQPGFFVWLNQNGDNCDMSLSTKEEAIAEASAEAQRLHEICECDNCGRLHTEDTVKEAKDLSMRTEPGGIIPSGECTECGALCYPLKAVPSFANKINLKKRIDSVSQLSNFQNATAEVHGFIMVSIATKAVIPTDIVDQGQDAIASFLSNALQRACEASPSLRFDVQIGIDVQ